MTKIVAPFKLTKPQKVVAIALLKRAKANLARWWYICHAIHHTKTAGCPVETYVAIQLQNTIARRLEGQMTLFVWLSNRLPEVLKMHRVALDAKLLVTRKAWIDDMIRELS